MKRWHWWLVYAWIVVVGILIGYFVIPFHHDDPVLVP